jgi:hypothetical protein
MEVSALENNSKIMWFFLAQKVIPHNTCEVNKFVIFIHSNIQYEVSIVTHITLKWQFDIR